MRSEHSDFCHVRRLEATVACDPLGTSTDALLLALILPLPRPLPGDVKGDLSEEFWQMKQCVQLISDELFFASGDVRTNLG